MSVAPNSGIIEFGTFVSPTGVQDGVQGQVPAPLVSETGYVLSTSGWVPGGGGGGGSGTVTSVALSTGTTGLTVSGSPITTSGTFTLDGVLGVANGGTGASSLTGIVKGSGTSAFAAAIAGIDYLAPFGSQTQATFYAAPSGSAGTPTFRAILASDVPTLNQNTTGTAANVTGTVAVANGGTGATDAGTARDNLTAQKTITSGTATPTGGADGDIYLQYT